MDSEYLVTLLVVVPLALQPDWNNRVRISSLENWAGSDGSFKQILKMTGSSIKRIQVSVFSFLQYEKLTDMIVPRSSQLIYQVTRMLLFVFDHFHPGQWPRPGERDTLSKGGRWVQNQGRRPFFVEKANGKIVCYGLSLYSRQGKTSSWSETSPTTRKLWSQVWAYTPSLLHENWEYSTFISCDYKPFFFACWFLFLFVWWQYAFNLSDET